MIKNLPATAKESELKELFERYGSLKRFLVSPFNTLAIAEYQDPSQAKAAMKNLAYHKVNFLTPMYLEMAPIGFVKGKGDKGAKETKLAQGEKAAEAGIDEEVVAK